MRGALLAEYARRVLDAPDVPPAHIAGLADAHRALDAAVRQPPPLIAGPMDAVISLAHQRLPSSDAGAAFYWRMVYIDASILKALARASMPSPQQDVVRECIAILDRAIIIAGAGVDETRRDYVVHDVIKQLQATIPWFPPSSAVFIARPSPAPHPLSTARDSVRALATLPSIVTAQQHWSRTPFVIQGYADNWPAMHQAHQWASLSYLYAVAGPGRTVPVEVGDDYRSDNWSQILISWEEFLSSLDPSASALSAHRQQHHISYLAQHNLLAQFPQLRQDIIPPDIVYACLDSPDFPAYEPPPDVIVNAWLGPKGTISPAHTDPFFNCYVQVVGRKTVWLAPPNVAAAMYPYQSSLPSVDRSHNPAASTTSPHMSNTSRVDVFPATWHETEASQTTFPLFWDAVPDRASCVTLNPGDLLFFPPGWWHAMQSEDVSFSVSMWF